MEYFLITVTGLALLTFSTSHAQINQTIEFHTFDQIGLKHAPRIISGTVYFESLPLPLKKTKVRFEIHFNYLGDRPLERDTLVHIDYSKWQMRISDTLFIWPAPIYTNEPFTGELEVTPLVAGVSRFSIHLVGQQVGALEVRWIFDPDGNLLYLGNPADTTQKGSLAYKINPYPAIFFEGDSIAFRPRMSYDRPDIDPLDVSCVITPVPRIGDTSFIICRVAALEDLDSEILLDTEVRGIDFSTELKKSMNLKWRGDSTHIVAGFVPLAVNGPHKLALGIVVDGRNSQRVPLYMVFNNDSTLRFIGNLFNYGDHPPEKYLPTAFQSLEEYEAAREEEKRVADSIRNADSRYFEGIR